MPLNRDIRKEKTEIRNYCRSVRAGMTPEERERADAQIFNRITNLWKYRDSDLLLCYVSGAIEVDSRRLIEDALRRSKRVAVPRCLEGTYEMDFYFITSFDDLERGSYGILEPIRSRCEKLEDFSRGMCVVPALCFDEQGYRLGFGKGYYDRFLSDFKGSTVGICYENCIRKNIPHGRFDKRADIVVTERRVISG